MSAAAGRLTAKLELLEYAAREYAKAYRAALTNRGAMEAMEAARTELLEAALWFDAGDSVSRENT